MPRRIRCIASKFFLNTRAWFCSKPRMPVLSFWSNQLRQVASAAGLGLHAGLWVGAGRQRSGHRGDAVRAVSLRALEGRAGAGHRLRLHGVGDHCSRPQLPGGVCADRVAGRRAAEHGVALHVLARRLPRVCGGVCIVSRRPARNHVVPNTRRLGHWRCSGGGGRRSDRVHAGHHRGAREPACRHPEQPLYAGDDLRRHDRVAGEPGRAGLAVQAPRRIRCSTCG
jgi:hypothetical protein